MKKHANIPIFIPHLGCPNQCVFCNQRYISGVKEFDPSSVDTIISEALTTIPEGCDTEIAYFGGSFTGIDRSMMIDLLKIANRYIKEGRVSSIRCSTRPDYIDTDILDILCHYGVKTVELGLQSIDDSVLRLTKRGHTREDEMLACKMICDRGLDLVGQMMIGLPASSEVSEVNTADFIIQSGAIASRIYPTVVFKDTELCEMTRLGIYHPLSIEDAVERTVTVYERFLDAGVGVLRIGLCSSLNLYDEKTYYAGPNHPALGELVMSRLMYRRISSKLRDICVVDKILTVRVAEGMLSKAIGQKKYNKYRLINEFNPADIKFREDSSLSGFEFKLDY